MTTTEPAATVSKLERGYCQTCGLNVALRKGGLAREHTHGGAKCAGSGLPATTEPPTPIAMADAQAGHADAAATVAAELPGGVPVEDLTPPAPVETVADVAGAGSLIETRRQARKAAAAAPAPPPGHPPVLLTVPLTLFDEAPDNVRVDFGTPGELRELGESIASLGLVEPIVGRRTADGRVEVIAGARRLRAARQNGTVEQLPVLLRDNIGDAERLELMLVENAQRKDLAPLEEAEAYRRLTDEFGYSQARLAERLGRSQGHISKRLSLLKLAEPIRERVASGGLGVDAAVELAKVAAPVAKKALEDATNRGGRNADAVAKELPGAIRRAKAHDDEQKTVKARTKELAAAGVRVVDWPGYAYQLPEGVAELDDVEALTLPDDAKHDDLPWADWMLVLADRHHACPGHAAGVDRTGAVHWVCTNVAELHPEDPAKVAEREANSPEARRQRNQAALAAAAEQRAAAMRRILDARLPAAVVNEHVALALIDSLEEDARYNLGGLDGAGRLVFDLLGVAYVEADTWAWVAAQAVESHGTTKVALAVALAAGEEALDAATTARNFDPANLYAYRPAGRRHMAFLVTHGAYTPAEHEQRRLDAADTDAAEEGRAPCALCGRAHPEGVDEDDAANFAPGEAEAVMAEMCAPLAAEAGVTIPDRPLLGAAPAVEDGPSVDTWEDPEPGPVDVDAASAAVARAAALADKEGAIPAPEYDEPAGVVDTAEL